MPPDRMTIHFDPVLIETGSRRILIDTGNGPEAAGEPGSTCGRLPESLSAAGIDPASIDSVVISHFHRDHVNGLLTADAAPAFAHAAVAVPAPEWAYWMDEGEMSRAPAGRIRDLFENSRRVFAALPDRVAQYGRGEEIAPGLGAVATPGHTPGHTSFLLSSGTESVLIQSDVTNHPALFARNPGWHAVFDHDPVAAEATRRAVHDMLARDHMPVQGVHYPFPGRARVDKRGDGYRVSPA
jgi:glyoxylase-like metal-dependent hydrolase (beta-lactamase superfamily II)